MYNTNFSSYGTSSFGRTQGLQSGQNPTSQYQGIQKQYQPVGFVQSFYGQNAGQTSQGYGQNVSQVNQNWGQATSPESFHTANYRGNQPGHDAYQRSDSSTPTQSSFQGGYSSYSGISAGQYGNQAQAQPQYSNQSQSQFGFQNAQQQFAGSQFGSAIQSGQSYGQTPVSPNAFHTANYRGNQPGHDAIYRSDSSNPTQASFQPQAGFGSQGISSFNPGLNQFGQSGQFGSSF
ncbi:hypothetical protein [Paenibacillus sedimenti]|uniref:Uncharacterized protein n=1 Tax=Paenibacillus sedimenti TaxID=2770274 RepID=A0A926KN38_9BACL|nr:hypothetical protein [Paenibacillus sedimenti]MBD0379298.1 hypothetical protein [Paenibacillus sedimenti]